METHLAIDQVQQHTQQGCGSTCPSASCWGENISSKFCGGSLYCTNFLYRRNIWQWCESRAWSYAWTPGLLQTDARIFSVQQVQLFISKRTKLFRFQTKPPPRAKQSCDFDLRDVDVGSVWYFGVCSSQGRQFEPKEVAEMCPYLNLSLHT